jgi:hypothetical protein
MAPRGKKYRPPQKKWSTKMKQNPVRELKSNWKSMGPVGKLAAISIGAGLAGGAALAQINGLPVIGRFMAIGTGLGARLRARLTSSA